MRVFLTGGTGAIGTYAVKSLVADGHSVTATARSSEKEKLLTSWQATPTSVSIFDREALSTALIGYDAVVNLATAIPPTSRFMQSSAWHENDRIRIEGSRALVDSAIAAKVPILIQESVSMLYRDSGAKWVDETFPLDSYPMAFGNLAAEANTQRFTGNGGTGIVLRFGWFYGPGAAHSEQFLNLAKQHVCVMMGSPHSFVSSIHVADGGNAVAAALHAPAGAYNVTDNEPLTKLDYANALGRAVNTKPWVRVPGMLALLLGNRSTSLTRSLRVQNALFRSTTGWEPKFPNARIGLIQTARKT